MGPTRSTAVDHEMPFRPPVPDGSAGAVLAGAGLAALSVTANAASPFDARYAASGITAENYDLHLLVFCGVLAIYCVVFGVMLYSVHAHRRAAGKGAAAPFHRTATVELTWNFIPWIILFGAAWPATTIMAGIWNASDADITIRATGMQWKWGYDYLEGDGEGISFYSNLYAPRRQAADSANAFGGGFRLEVDNPVVVPVNRKIRVVLAARDEIHSWHIPALGVKQFAVPGLARDTWFRARETGTYRGLCDAEACGAGRACVLIVVDVVSDGDYRKWVDGRKRDMAANGVPAGGIRTVGVQRANGG